MGFRGVWFGFEAAERVQNLEFTDLSSERFFHLSIGLFSCDPIGDVIHPRVLL